MGIARGPKIVTSGLVLALDAADRNSYDGNIVVYSVQCYSTYSVSLRSSNYTVQYSDDNSNWTTAFTGVMSNNSSCGIITGTGVNTSNLTAHKYWRYVEGSAVTIHHPRVSRIDFITPNGSVYNLITYTSDNCADSGTTAVGTVSKQFTPSTWRDLSGNNNTGTLTNGPTFNVGNMGSISFDGTDDYVTSPSSNSFAFGTGDFTLEIWIYPQSFSGYVHMISLPSQSIFTLKSDITTGVIYFYSPSFDTAGFTSGWTLSLNTWNCVVFKRESSTAYAFLNALSKGSKSGFTNNFTSQILNIHNGFGTEFTQCRISRVSIYNRALTATEILQNYNATKSRFGL